MNRRIDTKLNRNTRSGAARKSERAIPSRHEEIRVVLLQRQQGGHTTPVKVLIHTPFV